jgi:hypothetical protein
MDRNVTIARLAVVVVDDVGEVLVDGGCRIFVIDLTTDASAYEQLPNAIADLTCFCDLVEYTGCTRDLCSVPGTNH